MATKPPTREQLMSLPSFSASLSTLPNATSFNGLHLHANFTTTIQHTAESAAKLHRALQGNAARNGPSKPLPTPARKPADDDDDDAPPITIRKKTKFSL